MNVLIVYAHHEPSSFTASMKNLAIQALSDDGSSVVVSDLYGQGFSAVAQKWDFVTTSGKHFNYMLEQKHASNLDLAFAPDILSEIQKVRAADLVIFVFPLWWSGPPAILKGWFERVLAMGATWDSGKIYENGLMLGKQAFLVTSAGAPEEFYKENGVYKATPDQILHPVNHATLAYCGFNVHQPFVAVNVLGNTQADREQQLKELRFRLDNLIQSPQWLVYYS